MLKRSEKEVQKAICEYLKMRGYFFWRNNNVPTYDGNRGRYRAMPKYALKGVSDIILLKQGVIYFIECKSSTGKLSESQKEFAKMVTKEKGVYIVARQIEDLLCHCL